MLGGVASFVLDVRSERALRAAVAAAITSVGALYSSPKQGYWGLAMLLVQMVVSYFPTVSLGQALCPATALGWGFFIGCGIVSVLYLAATGGALALWFSTVLFILLLEPIISNEVDAGYGQLPDPRLPSFLFTPVLVHPAVPPLQRSVPPTSAPRRLLCIALPQDAYVAGVTMSFLFVVVDGVLLNAADTLTKSSFESNVEQLIAAWGHDGAIWSMYVSALMCMGLVLFIHLLPPWRSTSRLSARLVAQQLTEAKQIMEDVASLLDSRAREAVACAPPLESHVTIVPGLPSVKIQGLSERCTKQLVALRSLPGFLRMVDYEPVVWPPSARQVGLADWKELLGRIRMMLHRMYDLTVMLERRNRHLSLQSMMSAEDSKEFDALARILRQSVVDFPRLVSELRTLGGFLHIRPLPPLGVFVPEGFVTADDAAWKATAQEIQETIQERQRQQLNLMRDTIVSTDMLSVYRKAVITAHSHQMYGGARESIDSMSALSEVTKEEIAQLSTSLLSFFTDALAACAVRIVSPTYLARPMAEALRKVHKANGASQGWRGVCKNLTCWWGQPLLLCVRGYLAAPATYRNPLRWWRLKGRHFLRVVTGISFLHALCILWSEYRNFILPGSFAGWQVVAFVITLQGNAEATLKKGLLRIVGTVVGGGIGGVAAYVGMYSPPTLVCVIIFLNMAVVWFTASPPFTRFQFGNTDYDYAIQLGGINLNLILFGWYETTSDLLQMVAARITAQLVGISTAIVLSCCLFPESGYARARKLTARALKLGGGLLPPLATIFYGFGKVNPEHEASRLEQSFSALERMSLIDTERDPASTPLVSQQTSPAVTPSAIIDLDPAASLFAFEAFQQAPSHRQALHATSEATEGLTLPQPASSITAASPAVDGLPLPTVKQPSDQCPAPLPPNDSIVTSAPLRAASGAFSIPERSGASMPLSLGRSMNLDVASDLAVTEVESSAIWTWTATDDWNVNGLMTLQNHAALELLEPLEEAPDEEQGFPEIHRKLQKCMELMDGANSQLAMAGKYGSTWSKFIPGLGSDKEAEEHAVLVENMLSCVRSVVESVSASSSVLFGPFAIPHGSAISARGLICFLSTAMAKQGAEEFAQNCLQRWNTISEAANILGDKIQMTSPLGCSSCTPNSVFGVCTAHPPGPPTAPTSADLRTRQVVRQLRERQQNQTGAYVLAWLGFAQEVVMLMGGTEELGNTVFDLVTGYGPGDIFRLHCVLGGIMMMQSMLDSSLRGMLKR